MRLKLDDAGHVVVQDGRPVYVHADGKEIPFDAEGTVATISRLNGEAKAHREAKEGALASLKTFEGIDPEKARQALETVANLDAKKLIDAGEVERVKAEATKAFDEKLKGIEEKYKPVIRERDSLRDALHGEKVGNAFARSKFIADKLAIPADLVQAAFGQAFKVEGDGIIATDRNGNKLMSRAKPGEIAGFEEALEILVDAYPGKDSILKGSGASGGGANGGGGSGGGKTKTRAAFNALPPAEQMSFVKGGGSVVD